MTSLSTLSPGLQEASYSYGEASRLGTVSDETVSGYTATYSYLANSDLTDQLLFKQSTTTRTTCLRRRAG